MAPLSVQRARMTSVQVAAVAAPLIRRDSGAAVSPGIRPATRKAEHPSELRSRTRW
jgi:hypothetical protein